MESANVDLLRSIYADWERGDYENVGWAHPEIELVLVGLEAGGGTGLAAMAEAWRDFLSTWKDFSTEAEEYRELDDERVLVLTRNTGSGRGSGLEFDERLAKTANLFHIREGKVARLIVYFDRERALADVGLSAGAGSTGA